MWIANIFRPTEKDMPSKIEEDAVAKGKEKGRSSGSSFGDLHEGCMLSFLFVGESLTTKPFVL